jgi:superfamily I DNA and/or RNA helicase/uncharacterized membrane protein
MKTLICEKENMNNLHTNVIRCWRSIEETTPPIIETISYPPTVAYIVKEVLGDKEIQWLKPSSPKNNGEYTYYYTVFLGAIPLDKAINKIKTLFNITTEQYTENFDANKRTCLASFVLNDRGKYDQGQIDIPDYLISIAARIKYGHNYDNKENYAEIRNKIHQKIKDLIENVVLSPEKLITITELREMTENIFDLIDWGDIMSAKLHSNHAIIYQHKIKTPKIEKDNPEEEEEEKNNDDSFKNFFNSYFLTDFKKIELDLQENKHHSTIDKYLSLHTPTKKDVRKGNYYQSTMIPENIPYARWPSKGNSSLVLAQTLAVKESLATKDIFSINGPPGTGKTTLLKDIIANIIFQKADSIAKLTKPEEFFTDENFGFSSSGYNYKGWLVNENFLDLITVVASSNNEAVKNITKELPFGIDEKWNVDYFKKEAEGIFNNKNAVGLFSTALGNNNNKSIFFNKFWKSEAVDKDKKKVKIDSFKNTLQDSNYSRQDWYEAKNNLKNKIAEYKDIIADLAELNSMLSQEQDLKQKIDQLQLTFDDLQINLNKITGKIRVLTNNLNYFLTNMEHQKSLIDLEFKNKPSTLEILLCLLSWKFPLKEWRSSLDILKSQIFNILKKHSDISLEIADHDLTKDNLEQDLSDITRQLSPLLERYEKMIILKEKYHGIFSSEGMDLPDDAFWQQDEELLQSLSPWLFAALQQIRVELFILSNELIKCTIFINKVKLTQNLNIMNMMMLYGNLPSDMRKHATHIWNSFALVVPVISTTFASVSSLFKDLGSKQISYLLIDEAGQSSPHKALGAIWRSNKVIVVGDPLQIEPVETLPEEIGEQIMKINNIEIKYNPLSSSVQSFADCCNEIGTYITNSCSKTWVGSPLRIHRRCDDPMFKIANQISYDNLMIHKTNNKPSSLQNIFSKSLWIDIQDTHALNKWIKEEGELVLEIVNKIIISEQALPSLFIISPFRDVARQARALLRNKMNLPRKISDDEKEEWLKKSIGTVHTFQGKEAQMVIIILGCDEQSKGAVNWASYKPNILNVALTRAKNLVFIIGNSKIWGQKNYFDVLYNNITLINRDDFSQGQQTSWKI